VPFLREAFREVRIHTPGHIFFQLVELIEKLKEEKKHAGFKNVVNFLKDMTQTRYGIANFDLFDHILCENIKGYEKSAERQIILEKNKAFHKKIDEEMRILNEEAKRIAENFERQLREKKLTGKHEKILYHYLHPSLQTKQNNPFTKNHPLIKSSFGLLSSSFSPSLAVWLCGEKK